MKFIAHILFCITLLLSFGGISQAETIEYFKTFDAKSSKVIDHSQWDDILQTYSATDDTGLNRFDYDGISSSDKKRLKNYIRSLEDVAVTSLNKKEQYAFWLNVYNAVTIDVVLDEWPLKSIRDTDRILFIPSGPWKRDLFMVEGQTLSLDDVEHNILRPIFKDPRIHYGVNCASIGCPNLRQTAFTAENLEEELDQGARDFINSPRGIQKYEGNGIIISSIYKWFKEDFGDDDADILTHLRQYANPVTFEKLKAVTAIIDYDYDWAINKRM